MNRKIFLFLMTLGLLTGRNLCAEEQTTPECINDSCCFAGYPQGWYLDIGGGYTWMSFSSSPEPTFSGNSGGIFGSLAYHVPDSFFGEMRTVYNFSPLESSSRSTSDQESYTEWVGGYCFSSQYSRHSYSFTPYLGLGLDFLSDDQHATSSLTAITLNYQTYYAILGFEAAYAIRKWDFSLRGDYYPIFQQYLSIDGIKQSSWRLQREAGFGLRAPINYQCTEVVGVGITPYYRYLPIGASGVLSLPSRDLHQVGAFISLRFFL